MSAGSLPLPARPAPFVARLTGRGTGPANRVVVSVLVDLVLDRADRDAAHLLHRGVLPFTSVVGAKFMAEKVTKDPVYRHIARRQIITASVPSRRSSATPIPLSDCETLEWSTAHGSDRFQAASS